MNSSHSNPDLQFPSGQKSGLVLSVTEITTWVKGLIEAQPEFYSIAVRGEVTNLSKSKGGHIYFGLKDDRCYIKCVAFRGAALKMKMLPEDGREIVAHGQLTVYEAGGSYQLIVSSIEDVGVGALYIKFEELRKKLQEEGIFDETLKRQLPRYPRQIGIVTSPDGAALQDMLRILRERAPYVKVIISPSLVQGDTAPTSLIRALDLLDMWDGVERDSGRDGLDVVIIGRGGGSFEDLACFNDEKLARRVRSMRMPVISAVGHEVDFRISDFVADLRAATPTQAAVLAVPRVDELLAEIGSLLAEYRQDAEIKVETYRTGLDNLMSRLVFRRPLAGINAKRLDLDSILARAGRAAVKRIEILKHRLDSLVNRMDGLDPTRILSRGYSLAFDSGSGRLISKVEQAKDGAKVDLRVSDGTIRLRVDERKNNE